MSESTFRYAVGERHVIPLGAGVELAVRYIPPDEFRMGGRRGRSEEEPVSRVGIARGFWLGEKPVTQAQFRVWTAAKGEEHENEFEDRPEHPAENIEWRQAVRYCHWLGESYAGSFPEGEWLACLPTEAEWEYGCRARSETEYWNGDGEAALAEVGWYGKNSGDETHAVGQKPANGFGLYDMHGNVWEWCHDAWDEMAYRKYCDGDESPGGAARAADYAKGIEAMKTDARFRVVRGGSWFGLPAVCRSAGRGWGLPDYRDRYLGFRVCLAPGPAAGGKQEQRAEAKAEPGAGDGGRGTSPESDVPGYAGAARTDWGDVRLPKKPG